LGCAFQLKAAHTHEVALVTVLMSLGAERLAGERRLGAHLTHHVHAIHARGSASRYSAIDIAVAMS
jgi:hypothetical protein